MKSEPAMWLRIGCKLDFHIASPTPLILMLRPRSGAQQWVARESYTLTPSVPVLEFSDAYGNLCQRLVAPHGAFSIHTSADVQTADSIDVTPGAPFDEVQNLPDGVLSYLLPSRYCESDRYFDMASGIVAGVALRAHGCQRGQPAARRRVPRSGASGHRPVPGTVHSGAHGGRLPAWTRADGPACVVRSLRRRTLVHLRRHPGRGARRPRGPRLRTRRRRRGDLQPVRTGPGAARDAGDSRAAGRAAVMVAGRLTPPPALAARVPPD